MFTIEPLRTSKKVSYRALYQVVPSLSPSPTRLFVCFFCVVHYTGRSFLGSSAALCQGFYFLYFLYFPIFFICLTTNNDITSCYLNDNLNSDNHNNFATCNYLLHMKNSCHLKQHSDTPW